MPGEEAHTLQHVMVAAVLVMLRVSSALVTLPVFNSPAIPGRMKAVMVLVLTAAIAPVASAQPHAVLHLSGTSLLGEVFVGLCFGGTFLLLTEAVFFGAAVMSSAFSFSLANLVDPNSQVETEVLGTLLNWFAMLVLLAAGLHRTMLSALLRTLTAVPVGNALAGLHSGEAFAAMASGIFLGGLQLAAPVLAVALMVEVAVGLVSRMAPAMPAQIASVPLKTIVSYVVLIGGLALWPLWLERYFRTLMDVAQRNVHL